MHSYKDLFFKICDNFHNEINPVIVEMDHSSIEDYWFERKSIYGKFHIIKDILLSLSGNNIAQYQLINLQNILKKYKCFLENYFASNAIATSFIYFAPENPRETEKYFNQFEDYGILGAIHSNLENCKFYMFEVEIIGFPNDCTFKLSARLSNEEIIIEERLDPIFAIEKERGLLIGNPQRTRREQDEAELKVRDKNPELWEKAITNAKYEFQKYAQESHEDILSLLNDFERCYDLCNSLIDSKTNTTTSESLPDLERLYSTLKGKYINESFELFLLIFNSTFSGNKLIWMKNGPQLKYFIDRLNDKFKISNEINKWAAARFVMNKPVNDLVPYLRKQTTKGDYELLHRGITKNDPLYKLFLEQ